MGKGLKSKAGRILQFIRHGLNPNLFNPNGKRTVCSNAEDYDFVPAIEFDKLTRKGAKALTANVPLEELWQGKISGPLHYNLIDDQILPYWIAKGVETASVVDTVNVIDTLYTRPQLDRADREFFAVEEGKAGDGADLGCYGLLTSFKWTSKRGNKGTSRFEAGFVTQAAVKRNALTGGTLQNTIMAIAAANVSTDGVFSVQKAGAAAESVTVHIGDSTATIKAAFEALNSIDGVTVVGTVAAAAGELHILTANSAAGNATIYNTIVVTNGMTAAALQTAIRALGGVYANVTVTGAVTFSALPGYKFSGAANALANQEFLPTGTILPNGKEVFQAADGTKLFSPNDGTNRWFIGDVISTGGFYRNDSASNTPPLTGWVAANSAGPAPTGAANGTYSGSYNIQFPVGVGNVSDITGTPGTNWSSSVTQPGNAGGNITVTVTNPTNTSVSITKTSGAGWSASVTQQGSDGSILGAMLPEDPILPGHLFLYSSTSPADLYDEANLVGAIGEWNIDDPKICMPVSHHIPVVDAARPNLPATYNSHAEEDTQEDGIKLEVTMDCDDTEQVPGMVGLIRASGARTVSEPRYWGIVAIRPGSPRRVWLDFYGSIGNSAEIKFAGTVEQRTFVFDLLENKGADWNFRVKTRRPA
jgi:hypothetical protein